MRVRRDLTGQRFGRLVAMEMVSNAHDRHPHVKCKCDCGNTKVIRASSLAAGYTRSCGCIHDEQIIQMDGLRIGRLMVLHRVKNMGGTKATWLCRCDCGKRTIVTGENLRNGSTKSCGCYSRSLLVERGTKHSGKGTRLYTIWKNMWQRCSNPNVPCYIDYGGRGITVCAEWQGAYEPFRDWALANGYSDTLTIDRIDNDSGYRPDNCRWATMSEQVRNQRPRKPRHRISTVREGTSL